MTDLVTLLPLLVAAAAGLLAGYWWGRRFWLAENRSRYSEWQSKYERVSSEAARLAGELAAEQRSRQQVDMQLAEQRAQRQEWHEAIAPVHSALRLLSERVGDSEKTSLTKETEMLTLLTRMSDEFGQASQNVQAEARRLTQALSRSETRGTWGEMQLRRVVEAAGMMDHVHFQEQPHSETADGILRPDLVVHLAGDRHAVVDAKVPLDAFLRAGEEIDDATLGKHADAVAAHISKLSGKEYWRRFDTPEFVIMFLPAEGLLASALAARPELMQNAMDKRVLLATPSTLLAMLMTIDHSWRQVQADRQAKEIQQAGSELYQRVVRLMDLLSILGKSINKTSDSYNQLIASLESRVLPAGRKMTRMTVTEESLPEPESLADSARSLDSDRWLLANDSTAIHDPEVGLAPPSPKKANRSAS